MLRARADKFELSESGADQAPLGRTGRLPGRLRAGINPTKRVRFGSQKTEREDCPTLLAFQMGTRKDKAKKAQRSGRTRGTGGPAGPLLHVTKGGIGVDYSVPANVMLLSTGGISELGEAQIVAIAYGFQRHAELGDLPSVSLVCQNVTAAKKAWDVFEAWQRETDGDAVRLGWFFSSKGHYRLLVGADQDRLRFRLRGYDNSMNDLVMSSFYVKRFDSISKPTEEFRAYLRDWYSPFLFSACTESMKLIGKPLLKFHATEADEETLPLGSPDRIILRLEEPPDRKERPDMGGANWRAQTLKAHFPVTLARLARENVTPMLEEAATLGFQRWQLEQAAANLALSETLSPGRPHYAALQRATAGTEIVEGVRARHEMADSSDFASGLAGGRLIKQLILDANALLKSVGQPTTSSPEQIIARLRKAGLLETGHRKA